MTDEVVDGLAVFRLTRLVVSDAFPPVVKARHAFLQRFKADSWEVELLTCPWCVSFWIAAGVVLTRRTRAWRLLAPALAGSAVAGILSEKYS